MTSATPDPELALSAMLDNDHPLKRATAEWAAEALDPGDMVTRDAESVFFRDAWKICAAQGLQASTVPTAYGGAGEDIVTTTLKLGTSVLIAPYRGPLNDARQFATVDVLSGGRLLLGVGAGWMVEEFRALGLEPKERGGRTVEAIEIYKRAWTERDVSFDGRYYRFADISMDPKPIQDPRPPIIYGGISELGARRAARHCDGFYPLFLDPYAEPSRYAVHQDLIRAELDTLDRDPADFTMMGAATIHLTTDAEARGSDGRQRICTGSAKRILTDLQRFADAGYSLMVLKIVCPSGEVSELREHIERIGHEIIPVANGFQPAGGWRPEL